MLLIRLRKTLIHFLWIKSENNNNNNKLTNNTLLFVNPFTNTMITSFSSALFWNLYYCKDGHELKNWNYLIAFNAPLDFWSLYYQTLDCRYLQDLKILEKSLQFTWTILVSYLHLIVWLPRLFHCWKTVSGKKNMLIGYFLILTFGALHYIFWVTI